MLEEPFLLMRVLTDLKTRGVKDVFFVVCDGLKGLTDSVGAVSPAAIVQTWVIHLIRAHNWHVPLRLQEVLGRAVHGPETHPPIPPLTQVEGAPRPGDPGDGLAVDEYRLRGPLIDGTVKAANSSTFGPPGRRGHPADGIDGART